MQFYLSYRGQLASNGSPSEKHALRTHFARQLEELWKQKPLNGYVMYIGRPADDEHLTIYTDNLTILEQVGQHHFAPLVTDKLSLVCELDITLLRPEEPGGLVSGGDIDNRLKTLFDALSMPPHSNQIPLNVPANSASNPVFCLLKDDNLISAVEVRCDRLLDAAHKKEVSLLIHVVVRATRVTLGNLAIM